MSRKAREREFENYVDGDNVVVDRVRDFERELKQAKTRIDEIRRDHRRVAELYDVVVERRKRAEAGGSAPGDS